MAAAKKKKAGKTARPDFRWIALIFLTTVLISALMSFVSSNLLEGAGLALSFLILICIVLTGILFDIIGVAVTAADEVPFHAMASRKVPEAEDALRLIRKAGKYRRSATMSSAISAVLFPALPQRSLLHAC